MTEAERLALITNQQVGLVLREAELVEIAALEAQEMASIRDRRAAFRRAIIAKKDGDAEAIAFDKHRAGQRQPYRLPHVCTVIPFRPRVV